MLLRGVIPTAPSSELIQCTGGFFCGIKTSYGLGFYFEPPPSRTLAACIIASLLGFLLSRGTVFPGPLTLTPYLLYLYKSLSNYHVKPIQLANQILLLEMLIKGLLCQTLLPLPRLLGWTLSWAKLIWKLPFPTKLNCLYVACNPFQATCC